ncbi:MAG: DUF6503 family protein [Bacteroidota bacterium]
MHKYSFLYFLAATFFFACQQPNTTSNPSVEDSSHAVEEQVPPDMPLNLEMALEAHGGLDRWQSYKTLKYDLEVQRGEDAKTEHSVIDLQHRYERILYPTYEIGYDGSEYWYHADSIPEDHPDPKFYVNLQFYFFALPFVLGDPGINYEDLGQRNFQGKAYNVVKITYQSGVGTASDDQYFLYLDPDSHMLKLLLYSVTYFNAENATKYNAAVYEEWQEVNGLMVPAKMTSHKWDAEKEEIGDVRYIKTFSGVSFSPETSPKEVFAKPEKLTAS